MINYLVRLSKHTAVYGLGHILGRTIGILLLPIYTNYISLEEFSVKEYGLAFISFAAILYSAGLNSAQLRFYIAAKGTIEKRQIFSTSFWATFIISSLFSILIIIFAQSLTSILLGSAKYIHIIYLTCGILFFDALQLLFLNILRAEEKSFQFISYNFLNMLLSIILNVVFIIFFRMGVTGIFAANLVASLFTFLVLLPSMKSGFILKISFPMLRQLVQFGLPLIPSTMGMVLLIVIDRFIIREMINTEAVALYSAGYRLGMFMSLIVTAFRYAWHPFYLSIAEQEEQAKRVFSKVLTYFLFICAFLFLSISIFIEDIVRFNMFGITLFGKDYWGSTKIVPAILASYIFYGVYLNFQVGVYLKNKTKYIALTTLLSALLNIIANFLFIPYLGISGSAYATLIAYIFMAFSLYFLTKQLYGVDYEWMRLFKIAIITLLLYIIGTFSYINLTIIQKLLIVLSYFVVLYFVGFYEKKEIQRLKQYFKGVTWRS